MQSRGCIVHSRAECERWYVINTYVLVHVHIMHTELEHKQHLIGNLDTKLPNSLNLIMCN